MQPITLIPFHNHKGYLMPVKSPESTILKYRPALTLHQIEHIASIMQVHVKDEMGNVDTDEASREISKSVVRILVPLISKVRNNLIQPAYALSSGAIERAETKKVVEQVKISERTEQYRYENDLMSSKEQELYEAKILGIL